MEAARASIGVHAKVPSAGAGATRCAVLGPDQLSTTTKRVVALKTCAASKLFRCSGVVMAASAWVLARRGRCGPCIALMTKKVEEGRRRVGYFMQERGSVTTFITATLFVARPPAVAG